MKSRCIKLLLMGVALLAAVSAAVMLLWNLLIPGIFGIAAINFWQALGLFVLARILFGGFRFRPHHKMMHRGMGAMGENPIHEKWRNMTREQRKEFVEKRRKFGFDGRFGRDHFGMEEDGEQRKDDGATT